MMKRYLLLAVVALYSCGGGGSGSSDGGLVDGHWMTLNVQSNSQGTTTNTYTGDYTGNGTTTPLLIANFMGTGPLVETIAPDVEVEIFYNTIVPGTYSVNPANWYDNGIRFTPAGSASYLSQSGTVTLTSYGDRGQPVTGSFDAIVSYNTDTKRIWGSFSIIRFQ